MRHVLHTRARARPPFTVQAQPHPPPEPRRTPFLYNPHARERRPSQLPALAAEDLWAGSERAPTPSGASPCTAARHRHRHHRCQPHRKVHAPPRHARTLAPRRGQVLLHGASVHAMPPASAPASSAYISQRPGVAFAFTAAEVVQLGCPWLGEVRARDAAHAALAHVELANRAAAPLGELSVGQQQRVSLAPAIAQVRSRPTSPRPRRPARGRARRRDGPRSRDRNTGPSPHDRQRRRLRRRRAPRPCARLALRRCAAPDERRRHTRRQPDPRGMC